MEYIEQNSKNIEESLITEGHLSRISEAIRHVSGEFPELKRLPVVAGGACRDYVFGLTPKDYDIFIPVSFWDPEDVEDNVLLFGQLVLEYLSKLPEYPLLVHDRLQKIEKNNYNGNPVDNAGAFCVYESCDYRIDADGNHVYVENPLPDEMPMQADEFFDIDDSDPPSIKLQFIGRNDTSLAQEDLTDFVSSFDYDLVRAWYDQGGLALTDLFRTSVKTKAIVVDNRNSANRAWEFVWRLDDTGKAFSVTDTSMKTKSVMLDYESYTSTDKIKPDEFFTYTAAPNALPQMFRVNAVINENWNERWPQAAFVAAEQEREIAAGIVRVNHEDWNIDFVAGRDLI